MRHCGDQECTKPRTEPSVARQEEEPPEVPGPCPPRSVTRQGGGGQRRQPLPAVLGPGAADAAEGVGGPRGDGLTVAD